MATQSKKRGLDIGASFEAAASQFRNLDPKQPGQWPLLPKLTTWVLLGAMVVVLGWLLLLSDKTDELTAERNKEPALRQDYRGKLAQAVNLPELRKQKQQVEEYVTQLEKQLPGKAEMDALLTDINQAGIGRGLQFELFRPGAVAVKDYYAELPISIRVTGRYHDIAHSPLTSPTCRASSRCTICRSPACSAKAAATWRWTRSRAPTAISTRAKSRRRRSRQRGPRNESHDPSPTRGAGASHDLGIDRNGRAGPGCGADLDELQQWMEQQRREVKPNVPPLQPPKKFDPQPYAAVDAVEPFSTQKLAVALKRDERAPSSLLAAELKRRKEPLEAIRWTAWRWSAVSTSRAALRAVARRRAALPGQGGRLRGPELRPHLAHQRGRSRVARGGAGRRRRVDRAQQHAAIAGAGGAMKNPRRSAS